MRLELRLDRPCLQTPRGPRAWCRSRVGRCAWAHQRAPDAVAVAVLPLGYALGSAPPVGLGESAAWDASRCRSRGIRQPRTRRSRCWARGIAMLVEFVPVSYTHLRAHETDSYLVCR